MILSGLCVRTGGLAIRSKVGKLRTRYDILAPWSNLQLSEWTIRYSSTRKDAIRKNTG